MPNRRILLAFGDWKRNDSYIVDLQLFCRGEQDIRHLKMCHGRLCDTVSAKALQNVMTMIMITVIASGEDIYGNTFTFILIPVKDTSLAGRGGEVFVKCAYSHFFRREKLPCILAPAFSFFHTFEILNMNSLKGIKFSPLYFRCSTAKSFSQYFLVGYKGEGGASR